MFITFITIIIIFRNNFKKRYEDGVFRSELFESFVVKIGIYFILNNYLKRIINYFKLKYYDDYNYYGNY